MGILHSYLFRSVFSMTCLVLLVLIALGAFIEFLSQIEQIGTGGYDLFIAAQYVLLKLPRLAFGILPVSILIGALIGLGVLASNSELIVFRAAGVSLWRMANSLAITGLTIAIIGGAIGELIAPKLDLYARQIRAEAMHGGNADLNGSNAWIRDGNTFFNIQPIVDDLDRGGVYSFEIDFPNAISSMGRADSIQADGDDWTLVGMIESTFVGDKILNEGDVNVEQFRKLGDLLSISIVRESNMTAIELYRYIQYLESNDLNSGKYIIAFWSRMANLVGIVVMCILALPFLFGNLRSSGAGARTMVGILIGLGYFLMNRTLADSAAVFNLYPLFVAWMPTILLTAVTFLLLARLR
ncbi:MAG: LPS export ABC transporter permease LptG [Pseudomonadota bacterium]|nr:LPS export ABC transporter permease LptG [Pseudomonadota bacterium]